MGIRPCKVSLSRTEGVLRGEDTLGTLGHVTVVRDDHLRIVAHLSVLDHCIDVSWACLGQVDLIC